MGGKQQRVSCGRRAAELRDEVAGIAANFFPGMSQKWGISFLINTAQTPQGRSPGSLAWAGLANTFFWIDPAKRLSGVCVTQILPFFDHQAITLFRHYEAAVYKAF